MKRPPRHPFYLSDSPRQPFISDMVQNAVADYNAYIDQLEAQIKSLKVVVHGHANEQRSKPWNCSICGKKHGHEQGICPGPITPIID